MSLGWQLCCVDNLGYSLFVSLSQILTEECDWEARFFTISTQNDEIYIPNNLKINLVIQVTGRELAYLKNWIIQTWNWTKQFAVGCSTSKRSVGSDTRCHASDRIWQENHVGSMGEFQSDSQQASLWNRLSNLSLERCHSYCSWLFHQIPIHGEFTNEWN